jgi:hypothetical protein
LLREVAVGAFEMAISLCLLAATGGGKEGRGKEH